MNGTEWTAPWQHPDLDGWSIVGMNHYHMRGERLLFVAMAKDRACIKIEGSDGEALWKDLQLQARIIARDQKA